MASAAARPIANFHPNIWGDRFINYTPNYEETSAKKQEHESLKSEVRREFIRAVDPLEQLELIDVIERLGIAYHFEKQIESSLSKIYGDRHFHTLNLYHASLAFRILRQHGYDVSSDVFLKFTDDQGNFSEMSDAKALLSLYEAAYLRGNGEEVLENAVVFTTSSLKLIAAQKIHPLASRISRALAFPIHRRVIRIESRYYLSSYEQDPSHNASLLRFAKLDFILLQSLHKEELQELIKMQPDNLGGCRWRRRYRLPNSPSNYNLSVPMGMFDDYCGRSPSRQWTFASMRTTRLINVGIERQGRKAWREVFETEGDTCGV